MDIDEEDAIVRALRRGEGRRRGGRRAAVLAVAALAGVVVVGTVAPGGGEAAGAGPGQPPRVARVDPWEARRVPLTLNLRRDVPSYPGDPAFDYEVLVDDRGGHHGAGYLLEVITTLGSHTASHISAPAHFVEGGPTIDQLDERFTLMPLAVVDVRDAIAEHGPDFQIEAEHLRTWERRYGKIPKGAAVVLLTGASRRWDEPGGEASPYVAQATPGLSGDAVDWLFRARRILATGADALGPDASIDADLSATSTTLHRGGITIENVGPLLDEMRPNGDALMINCNRPEGFSGFQCGFTGLTAPRR